MEQDVETGTILLCALRYCVGRRTYMPGLVIEWSKRHWDKITMNNRILIKKEVQDFCQDGRSLGDSCDVETWNDFRLWLESKILEDDR